MLKPFNFDYNEFHSNVLVFCKFRDLKGILLNVVRFESNSKL